MKGIFCLDFVEKHAKHSEYRVSQRILASKIRLSPTRCASTQLVDFLESRQLRTQSLVWATLHIRRVNESAFYENEGSRCFDSSWTRGAYFRSMIGFSCCIGAKESSSHKEEGSRCCHQSRPRGVQFWAARCVFAAFSPILIVIFQHLRLTSGHVFSKWELEQLYCEANEYHSQCFILGFAKLKNLSPRHIFLLWYNLGKFPMWPRKLHFAIFSLSSGNIRVCTRVWVYKPICSARTVCSQYSSSKPITTPHP